MKVTGRPFENQKVAKLDSHRLALACRAKHMETFCFMSAKVKTVGMTGVSIGITGDAEGTG